MENEYRLEIEESQWFNDYSKEWELNEELPVYVSKETRTYKRWEDMVEFFFSFRICRDFCCGRNFIEDANTIFRVEDDEGGYFAVWLHKWDTFDEDVKFHYTIRREGLEDVTVTGTPALMEKLREITGDESAYVYWEDDSAGRRGYVDTEGRIMYDIMILRDIELRHTPYQDHAKQTREKWFEDRAKERKERAEKPRVTRNEEKGDRDPEDNEEGVELPF